jgi:hypothetical protein
MLGRRSHPRCVVPSSLEGVLSVSHDVFVRARDTRQITVVSREPGAPGERCNLTIADPDMESLSVRVSSSRPVIIEGSIRHVLQLKLMVARGADAS